MTVLARSTFRREPAAVPAARAFVRRTLVTLVSDGDIVDRLVLAAAEACNNVVFHAAGESFALEIARDGAACVVSVIDSGRGFHSPDRPEMPPACDTGHRGLALMYALVDRVRVESSPAGTAVVLELQLSSNGGSAGHRGRAGAGQAGHAPASAPAER